ncbi:MAG: hypothetical protein CMK32_14405 [Porticoccaceae bacterium]|nr:hypothetical protein [Porticoccaceae bacterium]
MATTKSFSVSPNPPHFSCPDCGSSFTIIDISYDREIETASIYCCHCVECRKEFDVMAGYEPVRQANAPGSTRVKL